MLPGGLKPDLHLEDGAGNDQLVLCTEGEESEPVVVQLPHSMLANDFTPYQVLHAHSSIEISHEYEPVRSRVFSFIWHQELCRNPL